MFTTYTNRNTDKNVISMISHGWQCHAMFQSTEIATILCNYPPGAFKCSYLSPTPLMLRLLTRLYNVYSRLIKVSRRRFRALLSVTLSRPWGLWLEKSLPPRTLGPWVRILLGHGCMWFSVLCWVPCDGLIPAKSPTVCSKHIITCQLSETSFGFRIRVAEHSQPVTIKEQ